jgi:hypothetical protein
MGLRSIKLFVSYIRAKRKARRTRVVDADSIAIDPDCAPERSDCHVLGEAVEETLADLGDAVSYYFTNLEEFGDDLVCGERAIEDMAEDMGEDLVFPVPAKKKSILWR